LIDASAAEEDKIGDWESTIGNILTWLGYRKQEKRPPVNLSLMKTFHPPTQLSAKINTPFQLADSLLFPDSSAFHRLEPGKLTSLKPGMFPSHARFDPRD